MQNDIVQKILLENREAYNQIAEHFSQTRKFPWAEFSFLKKYVQTGDTILDAGCGNGRLFEFLKDEKIDYFGLDSSQKLISLAQEKFPEGNFQTGDITTLPFSDNKFNAVFCLATLHHVPGKKLRQQSVKEFQRVLKPGGHLLMTNWNLLNIHWWPTIIRFTFKLLIRQSQLDWRDVTKPWKDSSGQIKAQRYLHAFTKGELKKNLKQNSFKIIEQFYSKKDVTSNKLLGFNLVTIAQKI